MLSWSQVPRLRGGVKETCPAGSWGHGRLVMDGPARGQATTTPPPSPPTPLFSHLKHPSMAREHSIYFQKLWENSPVGRMAFETKLSSLTSTFYLTPQDSPLPER